MAIDFPNSPSVGDTYITNGKQYRWDGTAWGIYGTFSPDSTASDTEPSGVGDGHIWYRSDQSQTLIRYDNTWVEVGSAGGFNSSSTSFPTSLDSGTGFAAVEALQAKVGVDSSSVTSSHDYKIADHASRITTLEGAPAAGLTLIKKVTFSGVTSFSEDNVFTSTYDNYLILISGVSSSASDTQLRLRVGGVDATGSDYGYQLLNITGTTVGAASGTITAFSLGSDSTTRFDHSSQIFGPAIADRTGWLSFGHRDNARIGFNGSYHNLTTAYDGFTILDNVGNITGTLWLYGYDKD